MICVVTLTRYWPVKDISVDVREPSAAKPKATLTSTFIHVHVQVWGPAHSHFGEQKVVLWARSETHASPVVEEGKVQMMMLSHG